MKKKKIKTRNPNSRIGLIIAIAVLMSAVATGSYYGVTYLRNKKNVDSGMFNAIVDAVAPTVLATVESENEDQSGRKVAFSIKDNEGGSALYGFCLSEYATVDEALAEDMECFDDLLLNSTISYNLTLEIPFDEVPVTYYAYASDNFGNISNPAKFIIEK